MGNNTVLDPVKLREIEAALDYSPVAENYLDVFQDYWKHPETGTFYCAYCLRRVGEEHDPLLHY